MKRRGGEPCGIEPGKTYRRLNRLAAYPDLVAVCGEPRFEDSETDTLINPIVIVDVLSPSTEAYDPGEKFAQYRRIDTLREYVLVSQDKIRVEHFRREGKEWIFSEIGGLEATLHLASIDCHVGVAAIYEKIEFDPLPG